MTSAIFFGIFESNFPCRKTELITTVIGRFYRVDFLVYDEHRFGQIVLGFRASLIWLE